MRMLGVLGGLGPAATVDFLAQLVRLTPARRDQEHLPVLAAILPQVPDRTDAILGRGPDPLPFLLQGLDLLNQGGADVVVITCNSAHHWYSQLRAHSRAPILHIGEACVARLRQPPGTPVLVLSTRGVYHSGFYAVALRAAGLLPVDAARLAIQDDVDACIARVKAGELALAGRHLQGVLDRAREARVSCVVLGCTELPLAARQCDTTGLMLFDSTQALAEAALDYAREGGS